MEKKAFSNPLIRKSKVKVIQVVCKKAACSGSSTHSATTYKSATVITSKMTA